MLGLIFSYFFWHYTVALNELLIICKNFLWFVYHFFSIDVLSKTLFSPWQRLNEQYEKGWRPTAFFEVFVVNTIMRIVGFFIRLSVIVVGMIVIFVVLILEIALFVSWLVFPIIIVMLFISGIKLLLNK